MVMTTTNFLSLHPGQVAFNGDDHYQLRAFTLVFNGDDHYQLHPGQVAFNGDDHYQLLEPSPWRSF